jgi:hypothetical protein
MLKMLAVVNRATTMSNTPNKKLHHRRWVGVNDSLFYKNSVQSLPPRRRTLGHYAMFPWRKEKEKLFLRMWRFPFLCVPLRVWEYTLGWPSLKGRRSSSYFYMFSCSIKERKREAVFMYVEGEIGLLMGSLQVWEHHQVVFSQENGLIRGTSLPT